MRAAVLFLSPLFVLTLGLSVARADLAPPDQCTAPGQPCQNAGAQYDQPGTCAAATCQRSVPNDDGGRTSMSYACNLCQATGAGTGGATGNGGSDGSGGATGNGGATPNGTGGVAGTTTTTTTGGKSSGCAIARGRTDDDGPAGLVAMMTIALVVALRRRHVAP